MSRQPRLIALLVLLVIAILAAGCTTTPPLAVETGTVQVTSIPAGAELYLDGEYRGTTPATISGIPAGSHTVELRLEGYERWSAPVTITPGGTAKVPAALMDLPATLPVTFATTTSPRITSGIPQIHVDGYWMYPQGATSSGNPRPLLVHTEAFNVGTTDAREVTVSSNFYYLGHMICWHTVYLGTLTAGGHVSRDSMVTCTLPSPMNDNELDVKFENLVVTK
ncbi:MAG: PEGA domain-containing protein [Methanomicrobiales archaeon]|nr:PEGA domain-containing protein [Methanomicrobiales archaeon]